MTQLKVRRKFGYVEFEYIDLEHKCSVSFAIPKAVFEESTNQGQLVLKIMQHLAHCHEVHLLTVITREIV